MNSEIKFLLLNILLLAGVHCSFGNDWCSECCEKNEYYDESDDYGYPYEEENDTDNNSTTINRDKIIDPINIEIINENINNGHNGTQQQKLVFKTKKGQIGQDVLYKCLNNIWCGDYVHRPWVILVELEKQDNLLNEEANTLVFRQTNGKWECNRGAGLKHDMNALNKKWVIFKVTTINEGNEATPGESHIFYCSDVSSFDNWGLFGKVRCYSIEILAANTKKVYNFSNMFSYTYSYLEQSGTGRSGFIGLNYLDLSNARNLTYMFCEAVYEQETLNSLSGIRLHKRPVIHGMFCTKSKNNIDFSVLDQWLGAEESYENEVYIDIYATIDEIFFDRNNIKGNESKKPRWAYDTENNGNRSQIRRCGPTMDNWY